MIQIFEFLKELSKPKVIFFQNIIFFCLNDEVNILKLINGNPSPSTYINL